MKFERFEDVPVWQDGVRLAVGVFKLTENKVFHSKGDIANQLQRAALSVSNNIAEGFERGTTQELLTFLYYARGSAGEVRSVFAVMERMGAFTDLKSQISDLIPSAGHPSFQARDESVPASGTGLIILGKEVREFLGAKRRYSQDPRP